MAKSDGKGLRKQRINHLHSRGEPSTDSMTFYTNENRLNSKEIMK